MDFVDSAENNDRKRHEKTGLAPDNGAETANDFGPSKASNSTLYSLLARSKLSVCVLFMTLTK